MGANCAIARQTTESEANGRYGRIVGGGRSHVAIPCDYDGFKAGFAIVVGSGFVCWGYTFRFITSLSYNSNYSAPNSSSKFESPCL